MIWNEAGDAPAQCAETKAESTGDDPLSSLLSGLVIVVGAYGSGKTEVAVNLAFRARALGRARVTVADLDVVNPYFRCREQMEALAAAGIETVAPPGEKRFADQPAVQPRVKGIAQNCTDDALCIFDAGGDDAGATVLSSLWEVLRARPYTLVQVVNTNRPFTDSAEGILSMKEALERKSRLRITGFLANSHLMDDTNAAIIVEGIEIAKQAARLSGLPLFGAAAMSPLHGDSAVRNTGVPLLVMERRMLPPWKTTQVRSVFENPEG